MQDYICRVCLRRCKISEYYAQRGRKELQTALEYFALFSPFIRLRHVRSHFSARQLLVGTVFKTHHEDSFCALSSCGQEFSILYICTYIFCRRFCKVACKPVRSSCFQETMSNPTHTHPQESSDLSSSYIEYMCLTPLLN